MRIFASSALTDAEMSTRDSSLCLKEFLEWLAEHVVRDVALVDIELVEDGLVQQAAVSRSTLSVQLVWLLQQLHCGLEQLRADFEAVVAVRELFLQLGSLAGELVQSVAELVLRSVLFTDQVEQVVFLPVELRELLVDLFAKQFGGERLIVQRFVQLGPYGACQICGEDHSPVVAQHGVFDNVEWQVTAVAAVVLLAGAEEVEVFAATPPDRTLH